MAAPARGETWHVDDDAPPDGDGLSWPTGFRELQTALARAGPGDVIRIAEGRYTPDFDPAGGSRTADRAASFVLVSGVTLAGGYAGLGSPDPDARDWAAHPTVLSGDLAGDDGPDFANTAENSYHVVLASNTAPGTILEGLTIRGGRADGDDGASVCFGGENSGAACGSDEGCPGGTCVAVDQIGAGVFGLGARATFRHCRILDNFAAFQGGGMLLKAGSDLTLVECAFAGNRALDNGGAIYCGHSRPAMFDCTFTGNSGGRYAGAMCLRDHSDAIIVRCTFEGNTAAEVQSTGGGAIVNASSRPVIVECLFTGNHALVGRGGAMYNKLGFDPELGGSDALVLACTFEGNTGISGGAVWNEFSDPVISACEFTANDASAGEGGGAVWNEGGAPIIDGCLFVANTGFNGGAVYNFAETTATITGCRFESNHAISDNGGAISSTISDVVIRDCQFEGNTVAGGAGFVVGGAIASYLVEVEVSGCTFTGNHAEFGGGAIYNESGGLGPPRIGRCTFAGNTAPRGGAMFNFMSSPVISSCLFHANEALAGGAGVGGAIHSDFDSSPIVRHCTIVANLADAGGGLSSASIIGTMSVEHSILWSNLPEQIADDLETPSVVSWSDVQGGWPGAGANNMQVEPAFADPGSGDFRLAAGSPCLDAGDPGFESAGGVDLDGRPRVDDGDGDRQLRVDLGAWELPLGCRADLDGSGDVGVDDLALLVLAWGPNPGHEADLDDDGVVGPGDVIAALASWGACPDTG